MTRELAQASARYAAAEMMLGGVTTVFDMYYFEDALAEALIEMNMRAVLAETIVDFANCDSDVPPYGGLAIGERFIAEWKNRHPLITPAIGPHATNTNSAEALKQAQAIAERLAMSAFAHAAEMDYEMETFRKERNQTPIEYLESIGLLSPHRSRRTAFTSAITILNCWRNMVAGSRTASVPIRRPAKALRR